MTVPYHPFELGPATVVDRAGRTRKLCALCGTPANAYRHRPPGEQRAAVERSVARRLAIRDGAAPTIKRITATAERLQVERRAIERRAPEPEPKAPTPRVADWRLSLLRLAIEQALGAELSLPLRLHLLDAQKSLRSDLYGTVATAEAATPKGHDDGPPLQAEPARGSLASLPNPSPEPPRRPSDARNVARAFRGDKYRELFLRAVDAGWTYERQANGHVRLFGPGGATFSLSVTATADRGHGWRNERANAKRAGLDVSGL